MRLRLRRLMTMKWNKLIQPHIVMLIGVMLLISSVAWSGLATESLKGTIGQITNLLNDPSLKRPEKKDERRKILHKLMKEKIDEEEVSRRALGSHWTNRNEEEKKEFTKLFTDLLERTYFEKIDEYVVKTDNFSEENILYLQEKEIRGYTVVETKVFTGDTEIPVSYLLKNKQDNWLICDIAIEGVGLLKNYRVQFNEILTNSSFDELLDKLKAKKVMEITAQKNNPTKPTKKTN